MNAETIEAWRRMRVERDRLFGLCLILAFCALAGAAVLSLIPFVWARSLALGGIALCGSIGIAAWGAVLCASCPGCAKRFYWSRYDGGLLNVWLGACMHCGSVIPPRSQFEKYDRERIRPSDNG
ncbi:MAG: hypothetical protein ACKVS9_04410 [Phycisphaerae bacterium]